MSCKARSLDVAGLYSSATLDGHGTAFAQASTHTEQIRERVRELAPETTDIPADLVPVDPRCLGGNTERSALIAVRNLGPGPAGASKLRASVVGATTVSVDVPELSPGALQLVEVPLLPQCITTCLVNFTADVGNSVPETDETNNQTSLQCLPTPG